MVCVRPILASLILFASAVAPLQAKTDESTEKEIAAIRAAAADYVKAIEQGKQDAVAAAWTASGDYIDAAGRSFKARDLIAKTTFKVADGRATGWRMTVDGIRLITADVAIEDGRIVHPAAAGEPAARTRYSAVWVKRDGRWLLDSLRESVLSLPSRNERFSELKWLFGEFTGRYGDGMHLVASGTMSRDGNFLLREILVTAPDHRVKSISQRIGWDPIAGQFKSWTFESDGGYGEGVWKREGESWIVNSTGVSADGKRFSATGIYSEISNDGMMMQSAGTTVEGKPRPDVKVKLTRETSHK
jgi:uncharacterized protein (TIGR02246 family)